MHVFDDRFSSNSKTAFGCNIKFPTSSLLLVCKRWLKVATPLLYRVVVLRSTAQAQALAEVFSQHPRFPLYVRFIRLEGAYSCLLDVIRPCSNLHTICFTLDIYAVVVVTGLCRALYSINPTRVILRDRCDTKNVKTEQVFCKLLECIPRWTNLVGLLCSDIPSVMMASFNSSPSSITHTRRPSHSFEVANQKG
jgi:hypothetical protein